MRRLSAPIALVASLFLTAPALAYIDPASVILERVASRRASLGFDTLVAEGVTPDGGRAWTAFRSGMAMKTEIRAEGKTTVTLIRGRTRLDFSGGETSSGPRAVSAAPMLELLGTSARDPNGVRGMAMLERMGVDADLVRLELFDGHPVYVIGAARGDDRSPQLWVDKRLLVPVRWVLSDETVELRGYHQPTTGPWFPEQVRREAAESEQTVIYQRVRFDARLPQGSFEPPR